MSSILEALERAEQERNLGEKKLFLATDAAPPSQLKHRLIWLSGGALLLLNLIIWLVLFRGDRASDPVPLVQTQSPPPRTTALVAPQPQQPAASVSVTPRRVQPSQVAVAVVQRQPEPVKEAVRIPPPSPVAQPAPPQPRVVEAPVQSSMKPLEQEAHMTKKAPAPVATARPIAVQEPLPVAKVESELPVESPVRIEQPVAKVVPASRPTSPMVETPQAAPEQEIAEVTSDVAAEKLLETKEEDAWAQVPLVWEMSSAVQKKFAKLKVNIHVFNPDASKRFVIINMKRYQEGDSLEQRGMRLEQITPKGVVIDYGDGMVRM